MHRGTGSSLSRVCVWSLLVSSVVSSAVSANQELYDFLTVFTGEFNNSIQHQNDISTGATGDDLHYLISRVHVPVQIASLAEAAGPGVETGQLYLEQYYNNGPTPRQSIFNVIFNGTTLEMEMHRAVNSSVTEAWRDWRDNLTALEGVTADQLTHDPACNVHWTRHPPATHRFVGTVLGTNCVFPFAGQQVYIESEVTVNGTHMTQDERFVAVADGSKVSGSNTPYVYDKVASFPPLSDLANRCSKLFELSFQRIISGTVLSLLLLFVTS